MLSHPLHRVRVGDVTLSHGPTMYSSSHGCLSISWICLVLVCSHNEDIFLISQKYWCIAYAWLMICDQADSYLEVITYSFKVLTYHIPLASCFGGHSVIPKSRHQHVIRSQNSMFPSIRNCEAKNIGPNIKFVYENPTPLLPISKKVVPSSTPPQLSWN